MNFIKNFKSNWMARFAPREASHSHSQKLTPEMLGHRYGTAKTPQRTVETSAYSWVNWDSLAVYAASMGETYEDKLRELKRGMLTYLVMAAIADAVLLAVVLYFKINPVRLLFTVALEVAAVVVCYAYPLRQKYCRRRETRVLIEITHKRDLIERYLALEEFEQKYPDSVVLDIFREQTELGLYD